MMQFYETQRSPYAPLFTNQGLSNPPCYMPFPSPNHINHVSHSQSHFVPTRPSFNPSPQSQLQPYHQSPLVSSLLESLMDQGVISLPNQPGRRHEATTTSSLNTTSYVPIALPSLFHPLIAQGVISKQSPNVVKEEKDDDVVVGCEFSGLDLKLRHESVVSTLYEVGLPKQCRSWGMRFKCQEEHSSHLDWHVNKNRIAKKKLMSKQKRSRTYYATTPTWLADVAEVKAEVLFPGVDFAVIADKKRKHSDEVETAVPVEEDQRKCGLRREDFVEFYSHERDEWMYKDAVYLNAPQECRQRWIACSWVLLSTPNAAAWRLARNVFALRGVSLKSLKAHVQWEGRSSSE